MAAPSKQAYKFITRPYPNLLDDIEITGTLLPNRRPLTRIKDGVEIQVQPLKGEDIAWLMELKEVLFFVNPYYTETDPIISEYNRLGGTVKKFWKVDKSRVQSLTYYDFPKYNLSSGLVYFFGRIYIAESGLVNTYGYIYILKSTIPDTKDTSIVSNSTSYPLKPSDMSNVIIRDTDPYYDIGGNIPLICVPIAEAITNYCQITGNIISLINCGFGKSVHNIIYHKYIYHTYSNGEQVIDDNEEWTADEINWQYEFTFDGTSFSSQNVSGAQYFKLYIGDLQNPKILVDFRYDCMQRGWTIDKNLVRDDYRNVDDNHSANMVTVDISSTYILTDSYGIRYIQITASTLFSLIRTRILDFMGYSTFNEEECPVEGSSDYLDSVDITTNHVLLIGTLPGGLPPLAH